MSVGFLFLNIVISFRVASVACRYYHDCVESFEERADKLIVGYVEPIGIISRSSNDARPYIFSGLSHMISILDKKIL